MNFENVICSCGKSVPWFESHRYIEDNKGYEVCSECYKKRNPPYRINVEKYRGFTIKRWSDASYGSFHVEYINCHGATSVESAKRAIDRFLME